MRTILSSTSVTFGWDFFRDPTNNGKVGTAALHGRWLHSVLAPALSDNFTKISLADVSGYDVAQIYEAANLERSVEGWARLHSERNPSDDLCALIASIFASKAAIGWELPPVIQAVLERADIPFVSFGHDAVRFGPDIYFSVQTNDDHFAKAVQEVFVPDHAIKQIAAGVKFRLRTHVEINSLPVRNAVLVLGQTDIDTSLIQHGTLQRMEQSLDAISSTTDDAEVVLLKRHPYGRLEPLNALRRRINSGIFVNDNLYELLSSDGITRVVGLSSSGLTEARFFGKDCVRMLSPDVERGRTRFRVSAAILDRHFWARHCSSLPSASEPMAGYFTPGTFLYGEPWNISYLRSPTFKRRRLGPNESAWFRWRSDDLVILTEGWDAPKQDSVSSASDQSFALLVVRPGKGGASLELQAAADVLLENFEVLVNNKVMDASASFLKGNFQSVPLGSISGEDEMVIHIEIRRIRGQQAFRLYALHVKADGEFGEQ